MTTTIGSGLGATWGAAQETVVGTFTSTGMRWLPFKSEKVKGAKKVAESEVLHAGGLFELGNRRRLVFHEAKGPVELEVQQKQLGLFLKNMIGSSATATELGATGAYQQIHHPGDTAGMSMSLQAGRPTITGAIQPFSYNGCKITDWELSVAAQQIAKLTLTFDGWDEKTTVAYAAPSLVTTRPMAWNDATLLLGGVVATTAGILKVTGGDQPAGTLKSVSLKGQNQFAVDRQQIGSLVKREQLANNFRKYTGTLEVEFANLTDMYNAWYADTGMALQFTMTGQVIATAHSYALDVLVPQVFFEGDPPEVDGPGVISIKVPFSVRTNGTNPAIQFVYISTDIAI